MSIVRYIIRAIRARFGAQSVPMTTGVNRPVERIRRRSHRDFSPIVEQMRAQFNLRVRRWRTSMSGCAWRVMYRDGTVGNFIESPYPKTPISLAIFLHEVGHHAIGFNVFRRRCEEEYHAWKWAIAQMRELGIEPDARVNRRFQRSMQYAVAKALRRGIKSLPVDLMEFLPQAA